MTRPVVIKVGGAIASMDGALSRACAAIAAARGRAPLVIVPGGGPFADAVRAFDRRHALHGTTAHRMALIAMDQYAVALQAMLEGSRLVTSDYGAREALRQARIAVVAPSRWLIADDTLPHVWDATSDSAAAYIAGALDAECLVLVKAVGGAVEALVDPVFARVRSPGLRVRAVGVSELDRLGEIVASQ